MMLKAIKKAGIFILVLTMLLISGCFDSVEVDEMVYVVSIGFDSGINGNIRMSMLLAVPIAVGVGPEPGEIEKSMTLITVEAPTIYNGVDIVNSTLSKRVNFSHAKLVVISKELAQKGVSKFMHSFARFREFRPRTFLGVTRGKAEDFLKETKPILEINPAKYFELVMESYKYTGYSIASTIKDFHSDMESPDIEPVAALLDVNKLESSKEFEELLPQNGNEHETMPGNHKAGEAPVLFDNKSMNMGMAVFRADKMVGELDGRETVLYMMVTGKLGSSYFSIPEPGEGDAGSSTEKGNKKYISLQLNLARKPVIQVKMKDDNPSASIHVFLEGSILTDESNNDYSSGEQLEILEDFTAEYIRKDILSFLEKTRDVYKSDICGIGKKMKQRFLLWDDWIKFRWPDKYENAEFDVIVKVSVRRSGMTIKQISMPELGGD